MNDPKVFCRNSILPRFPHPLCECDVCRGYWRLRQAIDERMCGPSAQHRAECDCREFHGKPCIWPKCDGVRQVKLTHPFVSMLVILFTSFIFWAAVVVLSDYFLTRH